MTVHVFCKEPFSRLVIPAERAWIRTMLPAGVIGAYQLFRGEHPLYVGRSDCCLATRLAQHEHLEEATHLTWEICSSPARAYVTEAYLYHSSRTLALLNQVHPARPAGHHGQCPFCAVEGSGSLAAWKRLLENSGGQVPI